MEEFRTLRELDLKDIQTEQTDAQRSERNGSERKYTDDEGNEPEWVQPEWVEPEWKMLSLLLSYPGDLGFPELLAEVKDWAVETAADDIANVVDDLVDCNINQLIGEYVARFDFQSKTCLYLTAHELGDSRKRGLALVALRRMLADAGLYERSLAESLDDPTNESMTDNSYGDSDLANLGHHEELPDYIPLLFEFLAAKPADFDAQDVEIRLARVCQTIFEALPDTSPYKGVFTLVLSRLPLSTVPAGGFVFASKEKADLGELPYPLFYD